MTNSIRRRGGSEPCPPGCTCGKHVKPQGADSPNWVGDQITHKAMHTRVIRARGTASSHRCFFHAEREEKVPARDWAQLHETTGLNIADYIPLCRTCHIRFDDAAGFRPSSRRRAGCRRSWENPSAKRVQAYKKKSRDPVTGIYR